jgi:uncharacterized protein YidB (DUF937 family)
MKRLWRVGLVVVAVLALAGAAVGFVVAQTDGDVPVPGKDRLGDFIARLAENLGIEQEELEAAIDQTQLDLVDEAVADGKLTEEQAESIRERIESGEGLHPFARGFRKGFALGRGFGCVGAASDELAGFLGVTVDDLRAAMADGQSLAQIAEANGVKVEDLSAFLLAELEARLAEAVESGKIDQARADEILANAPDKIDDLINREGLPGKGMRHGGHGFPGGAHEGGFPHMAEPEDVDITL